MSINRRWFLLGAGAAALGVVGYTTIQRRAMDDLLKRLDTWLSGNRPAYYASLGAGASPADLNAYERQFGLRLPADLRAFWQWKNGTQDDLPGVPILDQMLMTVNDSATTKTMMDGMIGKDFEDPNWWLREWVPFTSKGSGDHYCVDTTRRLAAQPGAIIDFWHDDARRNVVVPSFRAWLAELVSTMEAGKLQIS